VAGARLAVIATLTKGYDLDYMWKQIDPTLAADPAGYYIRASETGGEPPGRWWGAGARALGLEPGQLVERGAYDLLVGERKAPDGTQLGRPPGSGRKAADLCAALLAAEPHATQERKQELRLQASRRAQQSPLFFDLTLSLSKSISIFHASLGENARMARQAGDAAGERYWSGLVAEIDEMIMQAVHAGFGYFQREAGYTRTGSHNKRVNGRETGQWREADLAVAHWLQHTSRDGDMQLHVHSQIAHVARTRVDGKWRAPDSLGYNEHVGAVGAITAQHLEEALTARFGVQWVMRDDGHGYEIKGISGEMMRLFSSRRESITAALRDRAAQFERRYGRAPSQRELAQLAQSANFATRKRKEGALDFARLHADWADRLARTLGVPLASVAPEVWHAGADAYSGQIDAVTDGAQDAVPEDIEVARAAQQALALAQQEKSAWTRADLVKHLGRVLPRTGRDPEEAARLLTDTADRILRSEWVAVLCLEAPDPVDLPVDLLRADGRSIYPRHGGTRYATRAQLTMEEVMVAQAQATTGPRMTRAAAAVALGAALARLERALAAGAHDAEPGADGAGTGSGLRVDQAAAALAVLADGRRVSVINAPAGAGKTRVLAALATAWREAGLGPVVGITASQSARNTLAAGGIESYNSAQFLGHLPGRRGARGHLPITEGTLIAVDEASMLGTPDLADLIDLAARHGGKVIVAGDTEQLQAVQNGGSVSLLADRLGYVRLTEPVRFRAGWERAASLRLRDGDATALADYDRHARITGGDPDVMTETAAADYTALAANGTDALLIAADHALRRELSRRVRENLLRLGLVDDTQTATIADGGVAGRGDLIMCTRNDHQVEAGEPGRMLANGDLLRIDAITAEGLLVRRSLGAAPQTGRRRWTDRQFLFADFSSAELGYAVNAHVAQGRTVRAGLAVFTGGEDRQHAYVALTRGTDHNAAYVFTTPTKLADPAPGARPAPELARYDRLTAQGESPAPGDRDEDPEVTTAMNVLAQIIAGRDGAEQSASQAWRQALSDADHLAVLYAIWAAETAPARQQRYRALLQAALPAGYASQASHKEQWLHRTLRTVELAGLDPGDVLARAVAEQDLTGARDIPAVVDARIRRRHGGLTPQPAPAWSAQIPETDHPERARFLIQLAAAMDDRSRRIGEHAAATSRPWAVAALGDVPDDPAARLDWQRKAAAIGAYRELSGHDHPDDPIGPEPATGSPDLRAAWHQARANLTPADGRDVRHLTGGQPITLRAACPQDTRAPYLTADMLRQTRTAARDANLGILRAYAEANAARRRGEHDEAARQETLAASYQAMRDAYRAREIELSAAIQDMQAIERDHDRQLRLAQTADAELRRRHPRQPWSPLPIGESQREPGQAEGQDHERATAMDAGHGRGSSHESQPSVSSVSLAEIARQIEETGALRRTLVSRLANRRSRSIPAQDPGHETSCTFPFAGERQESAILQPPKPEIPASPWILDRVVGRELDMEAAD
jgi:conjugative relaxase-like TrwC/TraI family protein